LQYLPNAVLAAVVFLIGVKLIDIPAMRDILRLRKDEFAVAVATAVVVVVVGVEQGIILAIVLSLLLHVRRHYAPIDVVIARDEHGHVRALRPGPGVVSEPGVVIYRFGAGIFYANAQRLSDELLELAGGTIRPRWIILEAGSIDDIDYTGAKTLGEIVPELRKLGVELVFADLRDSVRNELDRFGVTSGDGACQVFETSESALDAFHAAGPRQD
jgi:MFS superfamily sulfate permease-like transporter